LLTESLVLASLGGVLGVWSAIGAAAVAGAPGQATAMDWRVLVFVVAVTTLTGIVFGLRSASRDRMNVSHALKAQPQRRRWAQRSQQSPADSSSRDLAGASGWRRTVPAQRSEPPSLSMSGFDRTISCCSGWTRIEPLR